MKRIMKNILLLFLIGISGCSYFPKDITRTYLYKNVIHHYKKEDCNQEKEQAALFLFEYMDSKCSYYDSMTDDAISILYDSIKQSKYVLEKKDKVRILIENSPKSRDVKFVKDVSVIKSSDLIRHIDITYGAWKKLSNVSGASYQDYCDYILPYRVGYEKYEVDNTVKFSEEYHQFRDNLLDVDSFIPAMSGFLKSLDFKYCPSLNKYYPNIFSPKQIDQARITPRCNDRVVYLTLVFRALGIPATYDYVPQWGNHHCSGHSWLAIKWQGKWYAFDSYNGLYLNKKYRYESIPKVFRRKYSSIENNKSVDVTNKYLDVVHINIKIDTVSGFKDYIPAIAVFNKFKGYKIVDRGIRKGSDLVFKNLGRRVCYFIGGVKDKRFQPLINPIFIDSCGMIKYLNPNYNKLDTRCLCRKYPLTTRLYRKKTEWAKSLSGSWFEGSNDNFKTRDILFKIGNYNSYKEEYFKIRSKRPYKAIRMCCVSRNEIASLKFFDKKHNILKGHILHNLGEDVKPEDIFDDDMLTWIGIGVPDSAVVFVGYGFDKLQYISEIAIQTRNDGNQIVVGDNYQLLFYDNGWKDLGCKTAVKQEVVFDNVPSGGLYWLKNLTEGNEEIPFMFDGKGNQYWAGQ